jgi:hypothetical protein
MDRVGERVRMTLIAALLLALSGAAGAGPDLEWELHRTADGAHPDGREQAMLWLMNRARQDPAGEGSWLARESHADVAAGRSFFRVDVALLEQEFAKPGPFPPAAFDRRLYHAAAAHSRSLIGRDAQDHDGQLEAVRAAAFSHLGGRMNVFAYSSSGLNAHAALNIDWGPQGHGMQSSRKHRSALMSDHDNVGIAMVEETDPATDVGPFVTSAGYFYANPRAPDHYDRFLVGTVWEDRNRNGRYDPGEGFGGVEVMPDAGAFYAVTSAGGGYAIPIPTAGDYRVTFSGGSLDGRRRHVRVGGTSELLDLEFTRRSGERMARREP